MMQDTTTLERPNRQAIAFEVARTKLEDSSAEYDRVLKASSGADEAYVKAVQQYDRDYFGRYGLFKYPEPAQAPDKRFRAVHMALLIERAKQATDGRFTEEQWQQLTDEAHRIVSEYEEFLTRRREAAGEYRIEYWERRHDDACDKRHKAWKALLNTPAPDTTALLLKLSLLRQLLDECDLEYVLPIEADAKRLLGGA